MPDFFEGLFTKNAKIHEKNKTAKIKELDEENAFQKTEETFLDVEQGTRTEESYTIHKAGCGHMLSSPGELKGHCHDCSTSLCFRCANFRCTRCLCVICTDCSKHYHDWPYCKKCRLILIFKNTGASIVRIFHRLMSKGIG